MNEIPNVLLHFDHQVRRLEFEVVNAATGTKLHPVVLERLRAGLPAAEPDRDAFFAYPWEGGRLHSNGQGSKSGLGVEDRSRRQLQAGRQGAEGARRPGQRSALGDVDVSHDHDRPALGRSTERWTRRPAQAGLRTLMQRPLAAFRVPVYDPTRLGKGPPPAALNRNRGETHMRLRSLSALGAFAVLAMLLVAMPASGAPDDAATKTYIVQMLQAPVVAYEGDVAGLEATKPAKGQKIDPNSASVKKYAEYLRRPARRRARRRSAAATKVYDYTYTYNGFAAKLTDAQKAALEKLSSVLAVTEEEMVTADTSSTPAFLGLTAPGGLWAQLGGPRRQAGRRRRRGRRHRRRRLRHLAREPELLRPRTAAARRQARLPADPGLARQVHAGRELQRLDCATRS